MTQGVDIFHSLSKSWEPTVELLDSNLKINESTKIKWYRKSQKNDPDVAMKANIGMINSHLQRNNVFSSTGADPVVIDATNVFGKMVKKNPTVIDWGKRGPFYDLGKTILINGLNFQSNANVVKSINENMPLPLIMNILKFTTSDRNPELFNFVIDQYVSIKDGQILSFDSRLGSFMTNDFVGNLVSYIKFGKRVNFDRVQMPTGELLSISEFDFRFPSRI